MTGVRTGLVLVGGGSSERMVGIDKVWADVAGKPLFMHSLERFLPLVEAAVLVLRRDRIEAAKQYLAGLAKVGIAAGGASRQESVANGVTALPGVDVIAVHDVARPLAPATLLREGIRVIATGAAAGAIPAIPVADTIKLVGGDGAIIETVDRTTLRAVQTPQVFRASNLLAAHQALRDQAVPATDDALLLEWRGERVVTFLGAPENFKVTTEHDLRLAAYLLANAEPA